ncbi:bifunctional serine/threonine-protein kinase/ABC transporter substrate-binding protein [Streptomyces sp. MP131-18]|uniref:bifunctional serine/threonine-protein kinase/ABC transporter substrate-binding protein n=1 Tax=Streptomyces sp. MP131-18 TaxID=1857892 RepID=UPI00097C45AA|nr:bifunctional serine/threonine-protein kinase/ABC transporter substrate-binding protein [Streptomyces sp. MP131-18]ONK14608.1 Serine/threonine-protein kinase AfsK [Streptomyces sp. MP131-18]
MLPLYEKDPRAIGGYRLLGRLGAGGMGVVYLARSADGSLVALKTIRPRHVNDHEFRVRLRREVAALRRVRSRWAVPLLDAGPEEAVPWLATAYVPAPSLAEVVRALGPLPPWTVRALGAMLAEALSVVHEAGLVHRDVKPGNVLLSLDGPRLIDFGIARAAGETALTAPGAAIGSPGYLSPEQARGGELGPPSDVFSLGCVLVYAATGRSPFGDGPPAALMYRAVHDPPALDGVPGELAGPLGELLRKEPTARPDAPGVRDLLPADPRLGDTWLPEPATRLIAMRSAVLLTLPEDPPTRAAGPDPETAPADAPPAGPGRRRLLAAFSAGGLTLAAGAGAGLWTWLRAEGTPGSPVRTTVALQADLSGPGAALGRAQERGARLAVADFNARADRPFELELRVRDDGGDAGRAAESALGLAADSEVTAVIGPTGQETLAAVAAPYRDGALPWLPVSATVSASTVELGDACFPARLGDAFLDAPLLAWVGHRTGTARAAVVNDRHGGDLSWGFSRSFARELPYSGIEVVEAELPEGSDGRDAAAAVVAAGVDTVMFTGALSGAGTAAFARELRAAGFTGATVAVRTDPADAFLREAGEAAEGWVVSCPFVDGAAAPEAADFAAAHRARFGGAPGPYAAEAYDTVWLVARALTELTADRAPRRTLVARQLRTTRHEGIARSYAFNPDTRGVAPTDALCLYEVREGRFVYLGPYRDVTGLDE